MLHKKKVPTKLYNFCSSPLETKFMRICKTEGDNAIGSCMVTFYVNGEEEVRESINILSQDSEGLKQLKDTIYDIYRQTSEADEIKVVFKDVEGAAIAPSIDAYLGDTTPVSVYMGENSSLNGLGNLNGLGGSADKSMELYGNAGDGKVGAYLARIHELEKQLQKSEHETQLAVRDTREDLNVVILKKEKEIDKKEQLIEKLQKELDEVKGKAKKLKKRIVEIMQKHEAEALHVKKGIADALQPNVLGSMFAGLGGLFGNQKASDIGQALLGGIANHQSPQQEVVYENPYSEKTAIIADWFEGLDEVEGNYQDKVISILSGPINEGRNKDIDVIISLINAHNANLQTQP